MTSYKKIIALAVLCLSMATLAQANVLRDILKAYQTYQEVNMALWLAGDIDAEKRLGKELQFWMNLTYKEEKDPKTVGYVKGLFERLRPHFRDRGMNYNVRVIRNNTANAFVIPGGHVYVFTGLINMVSSDDELAAVISHELAHAERRHSLKNFRASTAAVAVLNHAIKNKKDRQTWGTLLGYLTLMQFSREQEREADDIGQFRMAAAGFNPAAQVTLWEKFLKKYGDSKGLEQYLGTHPPSSERVRNARNNLAKMNVSEKTVFSNTRMLMKAQPINMLANPSFEDSSKPGGMSQSWELTEGVAALSDKVFMHGRHSLELRSDKRLKRTRVMSDFIAVNENSDFNISAFVRSEDGSQNAALGIELYDASKRLRNRLWFVESSPIPVSWAKIEARLVNSKEQKVFAANNAFMRIVLQSGLMSTGSVWFDDLCLKPGDAKDPVNYITAGDFEYADSSGRPAGISGEASLVALDNARANTGYSSLRVEGAKKGETGFAFAPISVESFKAGQQAACSFYFFSEKQLRGILVVELVDAAGKVLSRRLAETQFETSPNNWNGTSFVFKYELTPEEAGVKAIQVRVAANIKPDESIWFDSFVMR